MAIEDRILVFSFSDMRYYPIDVAAALTPYNGNTDGYGIHRVPEADESGSWISRRDLVPMQITREYEVRYTDPIDELPRLIIERTRQAMVQDGIAEKPNAYCLLYGFQNSPDSRTFRWSTSYDLLIPYGFNVYLQCATEDPSRHWADTPFMDN